MIWKKLQYMFSPRLKVVTGLTIPIQVKTASGLVIAETTTNLNFPEERYLLNVYQDTKKHKRAMLNALRTLNKNVLNEGAEKLLEAHREEKYHKNMGSVVYGGEHVILAEWDLQLISRRMTFAEWLRYMDSKKNKVETPLTGTKKRK